MKNLILILVILLSSCGQGAFERNEEGLIGNVKSMKLTTNTKNSWIAGDVCYEYDRSGNKIKYITSSSETVYSYNKDGKISTAIQKSDGITEEVQLYKYDNKGRLIKKTANMNFRSLKSGKTEWVTNYEYQDKGSGYLMQESAFKDGVFRRMSISEYDRKNRKRGERRYDEYKELFMNYKYSTKGYLIETERLDSYSKTKYKNDKNGNCIKKTLHRENGDEEKTIAKYDSYGNETEVKEYENGVLTKNWVIKYEYDNYGNWVKASMYEIKAGFETLIDTRNREIKYY